MEPTVYISIIVSCMVVGYRGCVWGCVCPETFFDASTSLQSYQWPVGNQKKQGPSWNVADFLTAFPWVLVFTSKTEAPSSPQKSTYNELADSEGMACLPSFPKMDAASVKPLVLLLCFWLRYLAVAEDENETSGILVWCWMFLPVGFSSMTCCLILLFFLGIFLWRIFLKNVLMCSWHLDDHWNRSKWLPGRGLAVPCTHS